MSKCPHCDQTHLNGTDYCPRTGKPLVDVATRMIGRTIAGKYRLISCLGQGGMGTIFQAEHTVIGNSVAVKLLHEPFAASREPVQRLYREARATGAIGHPNIINIFDVGETNEGIPFLVMELLEGESLGEHLERNGPRPLGFILNMGIQMLSALQAAHKAGIIHRDLKSDNVFLMQSDEPTGVKIKLLDFGVSKFLTPDGDGLNLTQTGSILGTPYYMSPEQASGKKDLDHRLDIYAAGVILYECLTGAVPHQASNYNALLMEIITEDVKSFRWQRPDMPKQLETAIVKALAREKEQRWVNASDFMKVLENVRTHLSDEQLGGQVKISTTGDSGMPRHGADENEFPPRNANNGDAQPRMSNRSGDSKWLILSESGSFVFRNSKYLIGLGVVLIALVAVAAVLFSFHEGMVEAPSQRDEQAGEEVVPVAPKALESSSLLEKSKDTPPLVHLNIKCRPSIARVFIDGKPVVRGGFQVHASQEPLDLVAEAEGYETKRMGIIPLKSMDIEVSLTPLALKRRGRPSSTAGQRATMKTKPVPNDTPDVENALNKPPDVENASSSQATEPPATEPPASAPLPKSDKSPSSIDRPMDNPF